MAKQCVALSTQILNDDQDREIADLDFNIATIHEVRRFVGMVHHINLSRVVKNNLYPNLLKIKTNLKFCFALLLYHQFTLLSRMFFHNKLYHFSCQL